MDSSTVTIQINCRISNFDSIMTFLSFLLQVWIFPRLLICFENEFWRKRRRSWESWDTAVLAAGKPRKGVYRRSFLLITTVPNGIQNQARLAVRIQIGRFIPESTSSKDTVTKKKTRAESTKQLLVLRHQKR